MNNVPITEEDQRACLNNKSWRMENLYTVIDEGGRLVRFRQRPAQVKYALDRHVLNVLLKSRQHGFSTWLALNMLDDALFTPHLTCGIIAHTRIAAADIFEEKIRRVYHALPDLVKNGCPLVKDSGGHLQLANGSSIRVGVSFRSATIHRLHISELGKICAKYPQRALEIKTGTLPAVHPQLGGQIDIESTAEGAGGLFYDICTKAMAFRGKLGPKDWKHHFFGWQDDAKNTVDSEVDVTPALDRYYEDLEKLDIPLKDGQKWWYSATKDGAAGMGSDMKREHPSTPSEAFEQSIEGAVYRLEMEKLRNDGRIGFYPWEPTVPVHTFWDLGYADATVILYVQFIKNEIRVIEAYSKTGRGAAYHAGQVRGKDYVYGTHYAPHDIMKHDPGSGVPLLDTYGQLGISMVCVPRVDLKAHGIEYVRGVFGQLCINTKADPDAPTGCDEFIRACGCYHYEWDEAMSKYKDKPAHDWSSHFLDALQTLAQQYREGSIEGERIGSPLALHSHTAPPQKQKIFRFDRRRRA